MYDFLQSNVVKPKPKNMQDLIDQKTPIIIANFYGDEVGHEPFEYRL